jgi:hypothetical protein
MSGMQKGIVVGALQLVLVLSLGAKLLYDRETRPRVWVKSHGYDPDLPIRGRYLAEQLSMPAEGFTYTEPKRSNEYVWDANRGWAYLTVRDGQLVAESTGSGSGEWVYLQKNPDGSLTATTEEPVPVFVSESAMIPALKRGDEMWVVVTVPRKGPQNPTGEEWKRVPR